MQEQARALGALVQRRQRQDRLLICGANVGAAKIKARQLGTQILTEEEYLRLIRGAD